MKPWRNTRDAKYRQRHKRQLLGRKSADIFRARHLADVEFQPARHAIEDLPRIVDDQEIEIDAVWFNVAGMERQHPVVETAGERDRQGWHRTRSVKICDFASVLLHSASGGVA
jgi:hypothetical protein